MPLSQPRFAAAFHISANGSFPVLLLVCAYVYTFASTLPRHHDLLIGDVFHMENTKQRDTFWLPSTPKNPCLLALVPPPPLPPPPPPCPPTSRNVSRPKSCNRNIPPLPPSPSSRTFARRRRNLARGARHVARRKDRSTGPRTTWRSSATSALTPPAASCKGTTTRVTSDASGPGLAVASAGDRADSGRGLWFGWNLSCVASSSWRPQQA